MDEIKWHVIRSSSGKEIGAVGFIGNKVAVVTAFYEDLDANQDGKVGWGEWLAAKFSPLSLDDKAVLEVALEARFDQEVLKRDPGFNEDAEQMFVQFAAGLVADGLYAAYFSRGVSALVTPIAGRITSNIVAKFVIRKGMEKAIKAGYDRAMKP